MKYFRNRLHGSLLLYPESWVDVLKNYIILLFHPDFKRTWKGNPNWYKFKSVHTIETDLEETDYPDLAGC